MTRQRHSSVAVFLTILFIGCYSSTNAQEWTILPGRTIDLADFAADSSGSILYTVLEYGGIWRSSDGGEAWEYIPDRWYERYGETSYSPANIEVYDRDANVVLFRIARSDNNWSMSIDGCNTFIDINDVDNETVMPLSCKRNESNVLFGQTRPSFSGYIVLSLDYGQTWMQMIWTEDIISLEQDPHQDNVFYRFEDNLIYRSSDNFSTWDLLLDSGNLIRSQYPNATQIFNRYLFSQSNGEMFVLVPRIAEQPQGEYTNIGIRSVDNGVTWEMELNSPPCHESFEDAIHSSHEQGLILVADCESWDSDTQIIMRSNDFGRTFETLDPVVLEGGCAFYQNPFGGDIYLRNEHSVLRSGDHGSTWDEVSLPDVGQYGEMTLFEDQLYFRSYQTAGSINDIYSFDTEEWNQMQYEVESLETYDQIEIPYDVRGDTLIALLWYNSSDSVQVIHSYDGGESFNLVGNAIDCENLYWQICRNWNDNTRSRILLIQDFQLWVSTDDGVTWEYYIAPFILQENLLLQTDNEILANYRGDLYQSLDDGQSWDLIGTDIYRNTPVWKNPVNGNIYSVNQYLEGNEWISTGEPGLNFDYLTGIPGETPVLLALEKYTRPGGFITHNIWISNDEGFTWDEIQNSNPGGTWARYVNNLTYDPWRNRIWVSTSLGLMYLDVDNIADVQEHPYSVPLDYDILSVYPNPFNGMTRVQMNLTQPGRVVLDLFTVEGRLAQSINTRYLLPGQHMVPLDAGNLASGTYFLRMQAPGQVQVKRVQLIR